MINDLAKARGSKCALPKGFTQSRELPYPEGYGLPVSTMMLAGIASRGFISAG